MHIYQQNAEDAANRQNESEQNRLRRLERNKKWYNDFKIKESVFVEFNLEKAKDIYKYLKEQIKVDKDLQRMDSVIRAQYNRLVLNTIFLSIFLSIIFQKEKAQKEKAQKDKAQPFDKSLPPWFKRKRLNS